MGGRNPEQCADGAPSRRQTHPDDGRELRTYGNGALRASGPLRLAPQGAGRTSVGTPINRVDYFKGAVLLTRMSRKALGAAEFLKVDSRLR